MNYRRCYIPGGTYFFTQVTFQRSLIFTDPRKINILWEVFTAVQKLFPFDLNAIVILPDHLHFIWTLPEDDSDYPTRIRLIKTRVTRCLQASKGQKEIIWQGRYWEHVIRDERDYQMHVEYIHYNPVKHGLVQAVADWPHSSFHRYVSEGLYSKDWGGKVIESDLQLGVCGE